MPITAALVESTAYRLRYLLTQTAASPPVPETVTIPNNLGVTPDLATDASAGPLDEIINARRNGYPFVPAGAPVLPAGVALTQAQARAIMNSDNAAGNVLTNDLVGRAVIETSRRTGTTDVWAADVNVYGDGDPVIVVTTSVGLASTCYLDLHFRHTFDL